MSITEIKAHAPALPAGRTPNELVSGPAAAANLWLAGREGMRALTAESDAEAAERRKILRRDQVALERVFAAHVAELERKVLSAPTLGAGAGAVAGGLWYASKASTNDWNVILRAALIGAALGGTGGFVGGHIYQRVYGPIRANVSSQLPSDIEVHFLLSAMPVGASLYDVPEWRIEGWREGWALLAARYQGTSFALALPPGAPTLKEMIGAIPSRFLLR